jgi:glycosyltransferase involved in cell wall biosynthesis
VRVLREDHQLAVYTLSTADHSFCDLRPLVDRHTVYHFNPPVHRGWRRASPIRFVTDYRSLFVDLERIHRRIAGDIDAGPTDLVFVHPSQFTQAPFLLRYLRTPAVYYCQEPRRASFEYERRPETSGTSLAHRLRLRLFESKLTALDVAGTRASRVLVANSRYAADYIDRVYGVTAQVCYLGVDLETFRELDLDRELLVLSVGGLHPFKGHDIVIRGLGLLPASDRPRLSIVADRGDAGEESVLRGLAARLGVNMTVLWGVSDFELAQEYNRARATVCASRLEPFGLVPLESMACGTPVVAVNQGGYRESVQDNRNGVLVDRNPPAVAAGLTRVLRPGFWEALHSAALREVQGWTWPASTKTLSEIFSQVGRESVDRTGSP